MSIAWRTTCAWTWCVRRWPRARRLSPPRWRRHRGAWPARSPAPGYRHSGRAVAQRRRASLRRDRRGRQGSTRGWEQGWGSTGGGRGHRRHPGLPGPGGFRLQGAPAGGLSRHWRRHGPAGQDLPDQRLLHVHPAQGRRARPAPEHPAAHLVRVGGARGRRGSGPPTAQAALRPCGQVHRLLECTTVCPIEVPNEFDENLAPRKAIYRPFPQAVPNIFAIDKRGTSPCKAACPAAPAPRATSP